MNLPEDMTSPGCGSIRAKQSRNEDFVQLQRHTILGRPGQMWQNGRSMRFSRRFVAELTALPPLTGVWSAEAGTENAIAVATASIAIRII